MFLYALTICIFLFKIFAEATIDLNISQLEYIANHLELFECQKLIYALHFENFDPESFAQVQEKSSHKFVQVSKESCLPLLLHWNQATNEGKGQTHGILESRLRQIGKIDLANWLGKNVFQELGQELENNIKNMGGDLANDSSSDFPEVPLTTLEMGSDWTVFDTLMFTGILLLILMTLILAVVLCCTGKLSSKHGCNFRSKITKDGWTKLRDEEN